MTQKRQSLIGLLVKIPLFSGLGPDQFSQVLKISHQRSFVPGYKIYAARTRGDEMLFSCRAGSEFWSPMTGR